MKTNEYKVRFCIHNKLFVEIDDSVIEIDNPYDDVPETVILYKNESGYQFEPYIKEKKTTYKYENKTEKEDK